MAYSTEQRKVAIDLLIQYDLQYTKVTAELGYPSSRELQRWYARFIESNTYSRKDMGNSMYSSEEKSRAISYYFQHGKSIAGTCKKLGYPHRETLRTWINEQHPEEKRTCTSSNLRVYLKQTEKEQAALLESDRNALIAILRTNNIAIPEEIQQRYDTDEELRLPLE